MHNIFISYHHANDQFYKDELIKINSIYRIFRNYSVDLGEISDLLPHHSIRAKIRDEYLRDSTVTIILVGLDTWGRKHIDWELYSSMYDGAVNKKSGIIVIFLPSTGVYTCNVGHGLIEKQQIYPEHQSWTSLDRAEYESRYQLMPDRIIDNLVRKDSYISIIPWQKIVDNPENLRLLIDLTHQDRAKCKYDLSRPMRMQMHVKA